MRSPRLDIFGWYHSNGIDIAWDPGEHSLCPVCAKPVAIPSVRINFMLGIDDVMLFYRVHNDCVDPDYTNTIERLLQESMKR